MNLRDLEYVLAVQKHGQFSQAAIASNVSQPALSNQIKKLERELGGALFDRLSTEVKPTALGLRVLEIASRMIEDAQRIRDIATEFSDPEALPFNIGMTPTLAPYLTKYFAQMFAELFPRMRVTMTEDLPDRMVDMVNNRDLDVALIARSNHKSRLDFNSVWSEPLFLAMRKGHRLSALECIRAEDVPAGQLIRLPYSIGYALEDRLPMPDPSERRDKTFDLSAMRFETVCRHISHSDDCTIVSALAAEQFKRDNWNLGFVRFDGPGNLRDLGAVSRPGCPRKSLLVKIGTYINFFPRKECTRSLKALEPEVRSTKPQDALNISNFACVEREDTHRHGGFIERACEWAKKRVGFHPADAVTSCHQRKAFANG